MPRHASIRTLAATLALATVAALPSVAGAATREPRAAGNPSLPATGHPFPDRLLSSTPTKLSRVLERAPDVPYSLGDGSSVLASTSFFGGQQVQAVIDTLGSLRHGPEIASLSVYVATRQEIGQICGAGVVACYAPSEERMVVSGESDPADEFPREFVIAHEYGHHIANHSANSPWSALDQGTKRWSTYERVCEGVRAGTLHPGDEGFHYWENPGEAFAQAYATLHFSALQLPWFHTPLLAPDAGSLAKIEADIARPLVRPRKIAWRGGISGLRGGSKVRTLRTPFDGVVQVRMHAPAKADFDLLAINSDGQRFRPISNGRSQRLRFRVCGTDAVRIAVRNRSGSGPYSVSVSRP